MKMGGADQQFCLRWNNFHTNITNAFESLRDDEDFVDITLACEGRQVRAHKMVLSACSPYFRNLLKGNPCQHPIVFLKDVTFANLASILDFMYHGEVNVSHNELATFLKTAEALRVRGLAEDDKKKDHENSTDANSPGPSKDPPDPGSPPSSRLTEDHANNAASPPSKRRRRRSASPPGGTQSSNDEQQGPLDPLETSRDVKNEPLEDDFSAEDHHHQSDLLGADPGNPGPGLKMDGCDEVEDRLGFALSDSVSVTRNQAAMQQLQDSFPAFLPAITQPSAFLSHNAGGSGGGDAQRGSYSMDAVQGLPPGMSTMAGPSMSQASASQDSSSQGEADSALDCSYCGKKCSSRYNLKKHVRDLHLNKGNRFDCQQCQRSYSSLNSLQVHCSVMHPTGNRRKFGPPVVKRGRPSALPRGLRPELETEPGRELDKTPHFKSDSIWDSAGNSAGSSSCSLDSRYEVSLSRGYKHLQTTSSHLKPASSPLTEDDTPHQLSLSRRASVGSSSTGRDYGLVSPLTSPDRSITHSYNNQTSPQYQLPSSPRTPTSQKCVIPSGIPQNRPTNLSFQSPTMHQQRSSNAFPYSDSSAVLSPPPNPPDSFQSPIAASPAYQHNVYSSILNEASLSAPRVPYSFSPSISISPAVTRNFPANR